MWTNIRDKRVGKGVQTWGWQIDNDVIMIGDYLGWGVGDDKKIIVNVQPNIGLSIDGIWGEKKNDSFSKNTQKIYPIWVSGECNEITQTNQGYKGYEVMFLRFEEPEGYLEQK